MRRTHANRANRRRGAVYVAVLGVALIVALIGLASMQISRIETRAAVTTGEMACAQLMAQSGIAMALAQVDASGSSWRTDFTHGVEVPAGSWTSLGTCGEFKYMLLDDDGDLTDDNTDLVTIRAIGRSGDATSVATVTYAPNGAGLSCLSAVLHADGTIDPEGLSTITTDHELSSNSDYYGLDAFTSGDIWAVGTIYGTPGVNYPVSSVLNGNQSPPRDLPDSSDVFDYYLANGTVIDFNDLPSATIEYVVLSAGYNPYGSGATNPEGIYIIDCQGNNIDIGNCRLEATLVILNAGSGTKVTNNIHWEPAVVNFPALLVQGNMLFDWRFNDLDESALGVNFNPAEDSDTLDTYPGVIEGLIYISGNLLVSDECQLVGVTVVGGACDIQSSCTLDYDATLIDNPPPGFEDGTQMEVEPGSWNRTAQ